MTDLKLLQHWNKLDKKTQKDILIFLRQLTAPKMTESSQKSPFALQKTTLKQDQEILYLQEYHNAHKGHNPY